MISYFFFFFFQAEDGIRDWSVTGVQTCALPIWSPKRGSVEIPPATGPNAGPEQHKQQPDRKSVVYGKSVDLGGRRIIKKKKKKKKKKKINNKKKKIKKNKKKKKIKK